MENKVFIDAKDLIAGRLGAFAAKQALLGNEVAIYNADKAVITGRRKEILARYNHWNTTMGAWSKGPFIPKVPDRFLRRLCRGMIPYKTARGKAAYGRIMCYKGKPEGITGPFVELPKANISKTKSHNYITVQEICSSMGGKQ